MKNDIITTMNVNNANVRVMRINNEDYISLTDIARIKNEASPSDVINKWMSNYDTIEFLGLWEELNNDNFNFAEFRELKLNHQIRVLLCLRVSGLKMLIL